MSEIDVLLQNARLRDEIEPYLDESVYLVDSARMPTHWENDYLASMLEWEKAPVLPISQWFDPPLVLPPHDSLDDDELKQRLYQAIGRLFEKNITLNFTEHLSDRQLYCLIVRDILPAQEKRIRISNNFIQWQCIDPVTEEEDWLRYYATEDDREMWAGETGLKLPPIEELPFPRNMPQDR
jgi:hypothetical protein